MYLSCYDQLGSRPFDFDAQGMVALLLFLLWTTLVCAAPVRQSIFNAADFGAVGDGRADNSKAFQRAWTAACTSAQPSPVVLVPSPGTFLLRRVAFSGPCRAKRIHFQVAGNIVAPYGQWTSDLTSAWITFIRINGLTIHGSGKIDGQGSKWWACRINHMLAVAFCDGFHLEGVHFANSPAKHVTVFRSQWVMINGISVSSPGDSPNTDGLLIQESKHVQVISSNFASGDDCVAIGTGSSDVNVTSITCGPGHGVSIGSLGIGGTRAEVERVRVTSSQFFNTMNGVRIKTWPGGSGFARAISFDNNGFTSVVNPVIIDQYYCGGARSCPNKTSAVEVSDIRYAGLRGTATGDHAIKLECSREVPCREIVLDNVVINSAVRGKKASSLCYNAHGWTRNTVVPEVPCLAA
ncbi:unnamed protein product [Spirodela intermedia]|uniref:Uncharacterized protein n=1 Tax=Spirodela intermedia TaxID=51605 RepID=A0A7I8L1M2_SPIIN|nr:unnamed protein product [Spirodela intermedia]